MKLLLYNKYIYICINTTKHILVNYIHDRYKLNLYKVIQSYSKIPKVTGYVLNGCALK
jgi:hypothetical protein